MKINKSKSKSTKKEKMNKINQIWGERHFGSYQQSKLRGTRRNGRYSAVKSSRLSWTGQYKKCTVRFQVYYSVQWARKK